MFLLMTFVFACMHHATNGKHCVPPPPSLHGWFFLSFFYNLHHQICYFSLSFSLITSLLIIRTNDQNVRKIQHVHIKKRNVRGQTVFSVSNSARFESLYSLIMYYREHPLIGANVRTCLTETVRQRNNHEKQQWVPKTKVKKEKNIALKIHLLEMTKFYPNLVSLA